MLLNKHTNKQMENKNPTSKKEMIYIISINNDNINNNNNNISAESVDIEFYLSFVVNSYNNNND